MSRNVYRLMIVLLVSLAIPLQGLASSSAGLCMATGQHQHGDMANDHAADADVHEHSGGHAPEHRNTQDKPHCPPCVSCCSAAVIAPALLPSLLNQRASIAVSSLPHADSGALPDQLDRPPLPL